MKQNIISISDYEAALRGEIAGMIYHTPSDDELKEFETYVSDYLSDRANENKLPSLDGICVALYDCRDDKFKCCAECGDYFLYDEMNDETGYEYCLHCKPYYDPDFEWKLERDYKDEK